MDNFYPQNAYKGAYIESIGNEFILKNIVKYNDVKSILKDLSSDPEEEIDQIIVNLKKSDEKIWNLVKSFSLESIIKSIKNDLRDFNVDFDSWFNESSLGKLNDNSSEISKSINKLKNDGMAYEKDGATWLNTDNSGDDKHRVLVRDDGRATYFASDVAYHKKKVDRCYDE